MLVRPRLVSEPLHNPWMGWGIWAGPVSAQGRHHTVDENTIGFGDDAPLFDWVCLDWMWADLEPQEAVFTWDDLDRVMGYWVERGKQINLRVWVTDDPGWAGQSGAEAVCPDWLWERGAACHEYTDFGGRAARELDYSHESYQEVYLPKLRRFLEALAERYDTADNPFNLVGCMGYGHWGEWHTLYSNYVWPSEQAKHDILAEVVATYADIFRHSQLSISYCRDNYHFGCSRHQDWSTYLEFFRNDTPERFAYRQALDVALRKGFGLARHGFIDRLWHLDHAIMEQQWLHHPMYAEGNWSYRDMVQEGTHGTLDENIEIMGAWHSNYGHFYVDWESYRSLRPEDRAPFERGLRAGGIGYRLALSEAAWPDRLRPGQLLLLRQVWENQNVGRLYRRHLLKLHLVDGMGERHFSEADESFDPRPWVRGEKYAVTSVFHLPADLAAGSYEVRIALVDPRARDAAIALAMEGGDSDRTYRLGTLEIGG